MTRTLRWLAALLLPIGYAVFVSGLFWYTRGKPPAISRAGLGDAAELLLPSIVIYLLTLPIVWRRAKCWTALELLAYSILFLILATALIVGASLAIYSGGNSYVADQALFFVIPLVPPMIAVYLAYRCISSRKRDVV